MALFCRCGRFCTVAIVCLGIGGFCWASPVERLPADQGQVPAMRDEQEQTLTPLEQARKERATCKARVSQLEQDRDDAVKALKAFRLQQIRAARKRAPDYGDKVRKLRARLKAVNEERLALFQELNAAMKESKAYQVRVQARKERESRVEEISKQLIGQKKRVEELTADIVELEKEDAASEKQGETGSAPDSPKQETR